MSTPKFPTVAEQLLEAIAIASTQPETNFEFDQDDCLALVAHVREQANTLRSTQESLALCQRSHAEQLARADALEQRNPEADIFEAVLWSFDAEHRTLEFQFSDEKWAIVYHGRLAELGRRYRIKIKPEAIAARKEGA